jgi:xanthine phosphoribosyltransferase
MNKLKISWQEFQFNMGKLCRDISLSEWKPDYVVGLTRGGLLPAVMISHYFDVPMFTLGVSLRDHNTFLGPESNLWMAEDAFGYVNREDREFSEGDTYSIENCKNILIVDDINDSGATLNWVMEDWKSGCLPNDARWNDVWNKNVKFAVVVDNVSSKCDIKVDYCGIEINKAEHDVWIDFPYEDWWTK